MKLSAPPPPPPPPPEPPPGSGGQPDPNNPSPGGETPATPPPETPPEAAPAPAPPGPKPIQWPTWFPGIDAALVGLVLVLTFALGSFVARNSDVWLHLAAGKRLLAGQYTPGSDPFSFSAADRPWVNHSWLADAGSYLLYGGDGVVLCAAKAVVVTLAFGLLIAIRRPQYPLWPWAAVACVAALAAAPQFVLRPLVLSILFLSVTMFLVFRMPQKPGTWRFPIAIGVTFWLWANCDPWFFIGPLTLALLIAGDFIQTKLFHTPEEPPAAGVEEPLGRIPDQATLLKALGVGVVACMLNPHHVRVWELPVELTHPTLLNSDLRLRAMLYAPTDSAYHDNAGLGNNLNGLAYLILFLAGALTLGFGPGRARVSHIALWVGFAALSLRSVYAIPFFAVVTVPLLAAQLNAFSESERNRTIIALVLTALVLPLIVIVVVLLVRFMREAVFGSDKTVVVLSVIGRIASVLGVCALIVVAYPGWAHPDTISPVTARRVAWGVEPDPALVQAAEQFKTWRESGQLPSDVRGFVTNVELANYLAWYAPQEKVFINARYTHHDRELADYVALRRGLGLIETKEDVPNRAEAVEVLRKTKAEYVAIYSGPGEGTIAAARAGAAVSMLYREGDDWSPWYLDGRTTVFGWRPAGERGGPTFAGLRVDPVALALGPNVKPLSNEPPPAPLAPLGWEEPFVRPPKPTPQGVAEAIGWVRFKEGPAARQFKRQLIREGIVAPFFFNGPATNGTGHGFAMRMLAGFSGLPFAPTEATDPGIGPDVTAQWVAPILALRAARRAIAADPDHPDPYYALALALSDAELPLTESERALGMVIALKQCLIRLPPPERYKRGQFVAQGSVVARQLVYTLLGQTIPGRDRTGQPTVRGFTGMPLEIAPFNDLLGQIVVENVQSGSAPLDRRPFSQVRVEGLPRTLRPVMGAAPHFLALDTTRETLLLAMQYYAIDSASELPDDAKRQGEQLDQLRKEIDTALIRANEQYTMARTRGATLPQLVSVAQQSGLAGEALRLLSDKDTDLAKEFKEQRPTAALLWVSLALVQGRVEEASELLKEMESPEWLGTLDRTRLAHIVRLIRYQKALHAGEYKTAGEVLESGEGRDIGVDALLAELAKNKVTTHELLFADLGHWPPAAPGSALGPTLVFRFTLQARVERAVQARDVIATKLQMDARYFYRRGVLAVLEGDIPGAKRWFGQAVREAPKGWGLQNVAQSDALRYMRLIEFAERKGVP